MENYQIERTYSHISVVHDKGMKWLSIDWSTEKTTYAKL